MNNLTKSFSVLPVIGPKAYREEIKMFNSWLGGRQLSADMIISYLSECQKHYKVSSLLVKKFAIKRGIKELMATGAKIIDLAMLDVVFKKFRPGRPDKKVFSNEILSPTEVNSMLEVASDKMKCIIKFLSATGCRCAEMCSVKLSDCKKHDGMIFIEVTGKGKKIRTLRISESLFDEIRAHYPGRKYLFETKFGNPPHPVNISKDISKLARRSGRHAYPHLFRHTWATTAIAKTHKIKAVSNALGHSTPAITLEMYTHESFSNKEMESIQQELF